jgi:hypothetical protein
MVTSFVSQIIAHTVCFLLYNAIFLKMASGIEIQKMTNYLISMYSTEGWEVFMTKRSPGFIIAKICLLLFFLKQPV